MLSTAATSAKFSLPFVKLALSGSRAASLNVLLTSLLPIIHSMGPSLWQILVSYFFLSLGHHPLPLLEIFTQPHPRQLISSIK